ncbi:DUF998 domain-containing protein [Quadrisphaera granulorum]|uniref:DUF998 domain-containing protein n=1 Tax=Quadrisphaera granulorum TaxID=317664 RepID=UPI001B87AFAA|nr:DUF998 domain-containing protein [Quadrisphaera granulorum]
MARAELDGSAAVTRSLLGWGVVAGPFYVVLGLALALTRPGFELSHHALSLLMLGEHGWLQRTNLVLTGLMVLAAALGAARALRDGRGLAIATTTAIYGLALLASAVALPDPAAGFPPGSADVPTATTISTHGLLHIVFGALGFLALAVGTFAEATWRASLGERGAARRSRLLGAVVLVGFLAGAALAQLVIGTLLLWVAVLAGFAWLALATARLYAHVPHPLYARRSAPAAG